MGLTAEVRADGVALRWAGNDEATEVRLHRKLVNPNAASGKQEGGPASPEAEPALQNLLVQMGAVGTLDNTARFGKTYEYTAQQLHRVKLGEVLLELAGPESRPIQVSVVDRFPPAVPQGLVAVAAPLEGTIDLSWTPGTDQDLAGYIVYRRTGESADWTRVSGNTPLTGPSYRDRTVQTGKIYQYAVSAIDLIGNESLRSTEAEDSVPNP